MHLPPSKTHTQLIGSKTTTHKKVVQVLKAETQLRNKKKRKVVAATHKKTVEDVMDVMDVMDAVDAMDAMDAMDVLAVIGVLKVSIVVAVWKIFVKYSVLV